MYYRRAGAGGVMSGANDLKVPSLSDFINGGWGRTAGAEPQRCEASDRLPDWLSFTTAPVSSERAPARIAGDGDELATVTPVRALIPDFCALLRSPADPATTARIEAAPTTGRPLGRRNGLQGSRVGAVALSHPANPEQSRERTVGPSGSRTAVDSSELERSFS